MNRYPLWKYLIIGVVLVLATIYAVPNLFGEAPAVQVSAAKATTKVDRDTLSRVQEVIDSAKIAVTAPAELEGTSVRVRFANTEQQKQGKDAIERALNADKADPSFVVALNLVPQTPGWLRTLYAAPMYLGLDLRGGIHLMLQVDMVGAIDKRYKTFASDIRTTLRGKDIRGRTEKDGSSVVMRFSSAAAQQSARGVVLDQFGGDLQVAESNQGSDFVLTATIKPDAIARIQEAALKQNISTLSNRVNELGVAEPVIQQQGLDRIVVQLPGMQDSAKAKDILGRTATLEARLVDTSSEAGAATTGGGMVPMGSELFRAGRSAPVVLKRQSIFTGEQLVGASAGFDDRQQPSVSINLNEAAGRVMRDVSRENLQKPMAVVLFENNKGEVLTVATIQSELGSRFQITGMGTTSNANDLALLLRAGSLAAPMQIIEERTIGPSLGEENIKAGFKSVIYGFCVIAVFMCLYYMFFGLISSVALSVNLLMLVAVLSMLQATLTLPGMAAIALTLGMAIDSNVLINERVREELRNGKAPQQAIHSGYENAWSTILDSNITTLIAGLALLIFGTGPVRGFAVVHCLGILTSMFSAVFFSRGLVNLWYGGKKKLKSISIGQVWRPDGAVAPANADLDDVTDVVVKK